MAAGADVPGGVEVHTTDTITKMLPAHWGPVVVAGSHGGVYAGWCATNSGARAVILNDAGVGKDQAGTGSLSFLDGIGLAAATADPQSCRIAEATDMLATGVISAVYRAAAALGCAPGQTVQDCALRMRLAALPAGPVPQLQESRFVINQDNGGRVVIGIDSASLFQPEGAGRIVVTASHGALAGGRPDKVVPTGVYAAHIGDARSCYQDGVLSRVNDTARETGARVGMTLRAFIDALRQA